ncbi:hypothetical protein ACFU5K_29115, partial [Streptomyces sp. NPDC057428]
LTAHTPAVDHRSPAVTPCPKPSRNAVTLNAYVLAICQSFEIRREPVGKRIRVQISLLDGRQEDQAGQAPW